MKFLQLLAFFHFRFVLSNFLQNRSTSRNSDINKTCVSFLSIVYVRNFFWLFYIV